METQAQFKLGDFLIPPNNFKVRHIIETERLLLRDFEEPDWDEFLASYKDPSVQEDILSYQSDDKEIQRHFETALTLATMKTRTAYYPAIVIKENNSLIGSCVLDGALPLHTKSRIGWHIDNSYRGKGYATEAASGLLKLAFEKHKVSRIFADCFFTNYSSRHVMEKLGMSPQRNSLFFRWFRAAHYGEKKPIVRYQISIDKWKLKKNHPIPSR